MKKWRKNWLYQLLICLCFGGIHIFIGEDTEKTADFMTGIYGLSMDGFDYIRALLWLLPILSACTFCGMYTDVELGKRKYFTLPRYGGKKKFLGILLKDTQIGATGMAVLSSVSLGILGVSAAAYYGKDVFILPSQVVFAVLLYSIHLTFLVMLQTLLQILTGNIRASQLSIICLLIEVCFLKDLPTWMGWLSPGAWGSINYSNILRKGGFSAWIVLLLELMVMGSVVLYVRMEKKDDKT